MRVFEQEATQRPWVCWLATGWRAFQVFGFGLVTFYVIWAALLRTWFSKSLLISWAATIVVIVSAFILILLRFTFTYHERTLMTLRSEWKRRVGIIEVLGVYLAEGKKLSEADLQDSTLDRLKEWHRFAASELWKNLGEEYKDEFYKGSNTGSEMPQEKNKIRSWVNDRVQILARILGQLKETPAELQDVVQISSERQRDESPLRW